MRSRTVVVACLAVLGTARGALAQDRAELIRDARFQGDEDARRDLYIQAANPVDVDSLWAVSVYEIAQIMRDLGEDEVAGTWMRWVLRHGEWEIDRNYFAPSLLSFYDGIAPSVSGDPDAEVGIAATSWRWTDGFSGSDPGTLEVTAEDAQVPLHVTVVGQEELANGESATLPPGTYQLVASAEGFDTLRLEREVLPGVETGVSFELFPVLADRVVQEVSQSLVGLRPLGVGTAGCTNAVAVAPDLVVTSLSSLGSATSLGVTRPSTAALTGDVVQTDPAGDLAAVRVPRHGIPPLSSASPSGRTFAWSVFAPECTGPLDVARTRLADGVIQGLPTGALGAPLVDSSGSLIGLASEGGRLAGVDRINDLAAAASAQFAEAEGFPTKWVVVGAAAVAVGVAALVLLGGDEPTPESSTGNIVITIPSGS